MPRVAAWRMWAKWCGVTPCGSEGLWAPVCGHPKAGRRPALRLALRVKVAPGNPKQEPLWASAVAPDLPLQSALDIGAVIEKEEAVVRVRAAYAVASECRTCAGRGAGPAAVALPDALTSCSSRCTPPMTDPAWWFSSSLAAAFSSAVAAAAWVTCSICAIARATCSMPPITSSRSSSSAPRAASTPAASRRAGGGRRSRTACDRRTRRPIRDPCRARRGGRSPCCV